MKKFIAACALFTMLGSTSYAADTKGGEAKGADAQAVNAACSTDAATAGCGAEKVGTGLLKCLHGYKKAHHDFKFSDGCKTAMKTLHHDKKAK